MPQILTADESEVCPITTPNPINSPLGWYYPDADETNSLHAELMRELPPGHLLEGLPVEVFMVAEGNDDVLFRHVNDPERFTIVHLTWIGHTEINADHPTVAFDGSYEDFLSRERRIFDYLHQIALTDLIRGVGGDEKTVAQYLARAEEGALTRDENPLTHFCVYFAAYDPKARQVFMGHHKKSGKWLFNGGHMDAGEMPLDGALREAWEEWGLEIDAEVLGDPQLLTITDIPPEVKYPCRTHFDIWYFVTLDSQQTQFDQSKLASEFYENRWVSIREAQALSVDPATLRALTELEKRFA